MFKNMTIGLLLVVSLLGPATLLVTKYSLHFMPVMAQQNNINTTTTGKTASNFNIYNNSNFGLAMQYPSNWLGLSSNTSSTLDILFKSPSGAPPSALTIIAKKMDVQNLTLSNVSKTNLDYLKQTGSIISLNASTPSTLAGYPAYKIVYTGNSTQGVKIGAMQILSVIGNKFFLFTYGAPLTNYAGGLQIVRAMIDSVRINR